MKYGWTTVKVGCGSDHSLFQAQILSSFIFALSLHLPEKLRKSQTLSAQLTVPVYKTWS